MAASKGAGRRGGRQIVFSISLPPDVLGGYAELAELQHTTRTQVIRALLIEALPAEQARTKSRPTLQSVDAPREAVAV